jgi:hypothetical protein
MKKSKEEAKAMTKVAVITVMNKVMKGILATMARMMMKKKRKQLNLKQMILLQLISQSSIM